MGCDIHASIEYISTRHIELGLDSQWRGFCRPQIDRNYGLFSCLAGVRCCDEAWPKPISEPKGVPKNMGRLTRDAYTLFISEHPCDCGEGRRTTRDKAERWVKEGISEFMGECWISGPDWHSASYLFLEDLKEAYGRYQRYFKDWPSQEAEAIIAAMESLEKNLYKTRLVFWFDN